MTVSLYFSGGNANSDPAVAIGGAKSSAAVGSRLFGPIPNAQFTAGTVLYRCVYVSTDVVLNALKVWIGSETPSSATTLAIGWGAAAINAAETAIANQTTAPAGVTFSAPASLAAATSGGDFTAGQYRALWVRYTITATTPIASETFSLHVNTADTIAPYGGVTLPSGYVLNSTLSDEFPGSTLDSSKWYNTNHVWEGHYPAKFESSLVSVVNGELNIRSDANGQAGSGNDNYNTFRVSTIKSKKRMRYGYYEVRAKTAPTATLSSFWLEDSNFVEGQTEIDVYELSNSLPAQNSGGTDYRGKLTMTVHRHSAPLGAAGSYWNSWEQYQHSEAFNLSYNVFGLLWTATEIKWYFNGALVRTYANDGTFVFPMRMIIDSEMQPNWVGMPTTSEMPVDYRVQYMRAWTDPGDVVDGVGVELIEPLSGGIGYWVVAGTAVLSNVSGKLRMANSGNYQGWARYYTPSLTEGYTYRMSVNTSGGTGGSWWMKIQQYFGSSLTLEPQLFTTTLGTSFADFVPPITGPHEIQIYTAENDSIDFENLSLTRIS